ncbi:MAG TPA: hemolysin family protein [Candidatus Paceibacterota bacterium]|nr:hemolysin family protein [Candidatus Paceibacterota bacterium]
MSLLVVTILIVLAFAALFASVEAAIFCTSFPRAQVLKRQKKPGAVALVAIREHMSRPVTTLVIGTNITTIVGSLLIGHVATEAFGDSALGIITAVVTFLIIVFGEIFPKVMGEKFSEPIALFAARPLLLLTNLLTPFIWIIEKTTDRFTDHTRKIVSEEELKILSEIGSREGSIERDEEELIRRVFTLNDVTARQIMTPWKVVDTLKADAAVEDTVRILYEKPYSRYPVVDADGMVVGTCQTKDLLIALAQDRGQEKVASFMARSRFVPEDKRVDHLIASFLASRRHMFIVKDTGGKQVGVVTFEDALEQLVGEIVDETDEVVDLRKGV